MSETVSTQNELSDAEALTAHLIGDTTPEPLPDCVDDFSCCTQGEHNTPDPLSNLTPASLFLAIIHNNGLTDHLPADWEEGFTIWWAFTRGNLALIRTAVDAAAYAKSTGVRIPDLTTYLDTAIVDITDWTAAGDDQWTVQGMEARHLGALLTGLSTTDPGAYTHPLHQLVHTALANAEEPTVTGVYGWLSHAGAMGHPKAPYTLAQLQHLADGNTI